MTINSWILFMKHHEKQINWWAFPHYMKEFFDDELEPTAPIAWTQEYAEKKCGKLGGARPETDLVKLDEVWATAVNQTALRRASRKAMYDTANPEPNTHYESVFASKKQKRAPLGDGAAGAYYDDAGDDGEEARVPKKRPQPSGTGGKGQPKPAPAAAGKGQPKPAPAAAGKGQPKPAPPAAAGGGAGMARPLLSDTEDAGQYTARLTDKVGIWVRRIGGENTFLAIKQDNNADKAFAGFDGFLSLHGFAEFNKAVHATGGFFEGKTVQFIVSRMDEKLQCKKISLHTVRKELEASYVPQELVQACINEGVVMFSAVGKESESQELARVWGLFCREDGQQGYAQHILDKKKADDEYAAYLRDFDKANTAAEIEIRHGRFLTYQGERRLDIYQYQAKMTAHRVKVMSMNGYDTKGGIQVSDMAGFLKANLKHGSADFTQGDADTYLERRERLFNLETRILECEVHALETIEREIDMFIPDLFKNNGMYPFFVLTLKKPYQLYEVAKLAMGRAAKKERRKTDDLHAKLTETQNKLTDVQKLADELKKRLDDFNAGQAAQGGAGGPAMSPAGSPPRRAGRAAGTMSVADSRNSSPQPGEGGPRRSGRASTPADRWRASVPLNYSTSQATSRRNSPPPPEDGADAAKPRQARK
jgi:hypothetical protein